MSAGTYLPRLVLAAAAVASVATSRVAPTWSVDQRGPFDPITIDDQSPERTFLIRAALRSDLPLRSVFGLTRVHLELRARDVTGVRPAGVTVELKHREPFSFGDRQEVIIAPGGTVAVELTMGAWSECAADLCVEDYLLTFKRTDLLDDPIIDITGEIVIDAESEDGDSPPPGTRIDLDVDDLGPVP
jgi:hypothetical protein